MLGCELFSSGSETFCNCKVSDEGPTKFLLTSFTRCSLFSFVPHNKLLYSCATIFCSSYDIG